jgi:hypothetical protein
MLPRAKRVLNILNILHLNSSSPTATLPEVVAYQNKENPIIPASINFSDNRWTDAIQADIDDLNNDLMFAYGCDGLALGAGYMSYYLVSAFLPNLIVLAGEAMLAYKYFIYRNEMQTKISSKLDKLISVFSTLTPDDTKHPIALNLASVIAPMVQDEAVANRWLKLERYIPRTAFAKANPEFIEIFEKRGFIKFAIYDNKNAADAALQTETKAYNDYRILNNLKLMAKYGYAALYGKGHINLEFTKQLSFYTKTPDEKIPHVHQTIGYSPFK